MEDILAELSCSVNKSILSLNESHKNEIERIKYEWKEEKEKWELEKIFLHEENEKLQIVLEKERINNREYEILVEENEKKYIKEKRMEIKEALNESGAFIKRLQGKLKNCIKEYNELVNKIIKKETIGNINPIAILTKEAHDVPINRAKKRRRMSMPTPSIDKKRKVIMEKEYSHTVSKLSNPTKIPINNGELKNNVGKKENCKPQKEESAENSGIVFYNKCTANTKNNSKGKSTPILTPTKPQVLNSRISKEAPFNEVVRNKEARAKMKGKECFDCKSFFDSLDLSPNSRSKMCQDNSRHRFHHTPPDTPENYWRLSFPDSYE